MNRYSVERTSKYKDFGLLRILISKSCPEDDMGWIVLDNTFNQGLVAWAPDKVIADRIAGAMTLQDEWNEDHIREIAR